MKKLVMLLCLVLVVMNVRAEPLRDATLGLTLEIPTGFTAAPQLRSAMPSDVAHVYRRDDSPSDPLALIIVQRLGGLIGRERLDPSKSPPGFKGRIFTLRWKNFDVDVFEVPENNNGVETVTLNAQVPLKPAAVQIGVIGRKSDAAKMEALLRQLLKGLEGETNWISSWLPPALSGSPWYGLALISIAIALVAGGLVAIFRIARGGSRGAAIVLSLLIMLCGWVYPRVNTREGLVLSGSAKMLGLFGLLITPFVRARKTTSAAQATDLTDSSNDPVEPR